MTPPRQRLSFVLDLVIASLLVVLVLGSILAFGYAVWWGPLVIAVATAILGLSSVAKAVVEGHWRLLKSPLSLLGVLALGLAIVQLLPLPASLSKRLSPKAHAAYAAGLAPNATRTDVAFESKATPATLDRPATLRWLAGGTAGLVLFCVAAHFADRLSRSVVIWGSIAAGFAVCSVFGVVQLLAGSYGLYGAIEPGSSVPFAPTLADLADTPGSTVSLRLAGDPKRPRQAWPIARPDQPFQVGGLLGGPSAYLTLASIGLPLALGLSLQGLAPRGSREGLRARLRESNRGGLSILLAIATILGAGLVGYLAGPVLSVPFALGLALAGLPVARGSGIRWLALGLTALLLAALAAGAALDDQIGRPDGVPTLAHPGGFERFKADWTAEAKIARDFPLIGSGIGSFSAIWPYYKSVDQTATSAGSGLLQWWVEAGWIGLAIPLLAALWTLIRLPGSIARVGSADRALGFGLAGALATFAALWMIHGAIGPSAVALAACALGGTCNRWLAGGTDLFVEAP